MNKYLPKLSKGVVRNDIKEVKSGRQDASGGIHASDPCPPGCCLIQFGPYLICRCPCPY